MATVTVPDVALLGAVVEQVWSAMLHQPVLTWPETWSDHWPAELPGVGAEIEVAGEWDGTLRLWCAAPAAASMTNTLLRLVPGREPDAEDIEDALGEVLNVVAGNVKGALGGASSLGLPVVAPGPAPVLAEDVAHLALFWHGDPVLLSIHSAG